jgi:hypothetical protein
VGRRSQRPLRWAGQTALGRGEQSGALAPKPARA